MLAASRSAVRPFAASRRCCVAPVAKFSLHTLTQDFAKSQLKKDLPKVIVGDSVKVGLAVQEGNGKTRTQTLDGVIIAAHGADSSKTITFRRVFQGIGVELIMPVHSPAVQQIEFVRRGRVRRAKLFYLRQRIGKSARLKEVVGVRPEDVAAPKQ
ncbi:50S ribosomal protein L19, chloroplastic [Tetrabaena socialis]|uniref:50S ribosomal protein L19, chloroplastic n=1 Tax=Tetrabaena socialis TaxID=47790 RepID=A0A2J7ZY77_9CHLO|nr:50S ribosomal protein L19, chloroplastic [Tetrabaena socialis]|eukprot:PNH05220.1 50S ribosomal protein L19, chloroplastic [Tetrabaena socialis]